MFGVPASNLALAGSVETAPVVGSTQGRGLEPKNVGLLDRYNESGIVSPRPSGLLIKEPVPIAIPDCGPAIL
jgi:hypothetical protein